MPQIQLSVLAVLLLGSLLPLAESARVIETMIKAELDKKEVASHSNVKTLKTESDMEGWPFSTNTAGPKVCCCYIATSKSTSTDKCTWQDEISFDTGSGCNFGGKLNPFANKRRIRGITDQTNNGKQDKAKNHLVFDVTEGAGAQAAYARECEALTGDMVRLLDVFGNTHQYIVDSSRWPGATVVVQDTPPRVDALASEQTQAKDKIKADVVVKEIQFKVTSTVLKKYMRESPPNKALCSLACDMWPPVRSKNQTPKTGCHSKLSSSFKSNAVNYCKKVCTPDAKCIEHCKCGDAKCTPVAKCVEKEEVIQHTCSFCL